ncbi:hypothetical protein LTR05_002676 [Lithohypha guttulata]|uniref:Uncharacterized protein n=1 Tax=Lithohypha guttulata TaxID=1690604 RepID=A0AAN7T4Q0_9EURO|nr:hypothetical protein LTR05_002676 [Lithohypha guttulata]
MKVSPITAVLSGIILAINVPQVFAASASVYSRYPYPVVCALVEGIDPTTIHPPIPPGADFKLLTGDGMHATAKADVGTAMMCGKQNEVTAALASNTKPSVAELEWTLKTDTNVLWWDGSLVDGNPFGAEGFSMTSNGLPFGQPPPSEWHKCWDVYCAPGVQCSENQVYLTDVSDRNEVDNPMRMCPPDDHLIWVICPHN